MRKPEYMWAKQKLLSSRLSGSAHLIQPPYGSSLYLVFSPPSVGMWRLIRNESIEPEHERESDP